jgi:shikimate kinase
MTKTVNNQIISVGGGLPMREINRELLHQLGQVVYLRASAETIYQRVKNDTTRPLLQGGNPQEKIKNLLNERQTNYESAADIIVDVDGKDFEQIVGEIAERLP